MNKYLEINDRVKKAIDNNIPVVALESTIISHGMPYPQNVKTAFDVENVVRDNGAIPATIAIIDGKLKVGLEKDEIEYLGKKGLDVIKTSIRDMPYVISKKLDGATTVATTMHIANMAGIKVFATGGIGGVHRGAQKSFDISADLMELSRTDVLVVCAGVKSILDIGLTLEYLETLGVTTIGYKTDNLPAFYLRDSGFKVDVRADLPKDIAKMMHVKWNIGLKGGMVVGNPVPKEFESDKNVIENAINTALENMEKRNIKGKESTPFLLSEVKRLTDGKSLVSNIELVKNNAKLASEIAKELANMK